MGSIRQRRAMRGYQAKARGTRQSFATLYENALIVLAWERAELSEGQAAKALGLDRLSARILRDDLVLAGIRIGSELLAGHPQPKEPGR